MRVRTKRAGGFSAAVAAGLALLGPAPVAVRAEQLSWDADKAPPATGGAGTWNTTDPANTVWFSPAAAADVAWINAGQVPGTVDDALFAGTGATVIVGEAVTVRSITISPTAGSTYTINSGAPGSVITLSGADVGAQTISVTSAAAVTNIGAHVTGGGWNVNNTSGQALTFNGGNLTFTGLRTTGTGVVNLQQAAGTAWNLSGNVEVAGTGLLDLRYQNSGADGSDLAGVALNTLTINAGGTNNANRGLFNVSRVTGTIDNRVAFAGGLVLKSHALLDPNAAHISVGDITVDPAGQAGAYTRNLQWFDAVNNALTDQGIDFSGRVNGDANGTLELGMPASFNMTVDNSATMLGTIGLTNERTSNHTVGLNISGAFGGLGSVRPAANNTIRLDLNVVPTAKDKLEARAGTLLLGTDVQLAGLTRVPTVGATAGTVGTVKLDANSYVVHETNAATTVADVSLGGTVADVYFAFTATRTQNLTVGTNSGWKGIATDRDGDRSWTTGTVTVNGPFELQGINGRTLILGNGTNASTLNVTGAAPAVATISAGTVRLNAGGATPTANLSGISQFSVASGAFLAFGQLNALGGVAASATPTVAVQAGGGLQWDNVEQTFTGADTTFAGNYTLRPNATVTHSPALTYPTASNTVTFAGSQLMVLAGGAATGTGAATGNTTLTSGAIGVSNMAAIGDGNLNLNGGVIVLDNLGLAGFVADRAAAGTGANQVQFNSGGFAARGTPVTLTVGGPITATSFDRNFTLGWHSSVGGSLYANAPVDLTISTALTARRNILIGTAGPGLTNNTAGVVNVISGNLSGAGAPIFRSTSNGSDSQVAELLLTGTNTWTGAPTEDFDGGGVNVWTSAGKGGLIISTAQTNPGTNGDLFVRFQGQASLPNGNGGTTAAYLMANRYGNTGTPPAVVEGRSGYLLTGNGTPAGETYRLNPGYKFVLGGAYNTGAGATLGSTGGTATLENTTVALIRDSNTNGTGILFVRDGTFKLGSTSGANAGPVVFQPANIANSGGTDPGINAAASALSDPTATTLRTLIKRGAGTLEVVDVNYAKVDGTTAASSQFRWDVREGTVLYNEATAGNAMESSTVGLATGQTATATLGGSGVFGLGAGKTLTATGTSAAVRAVIAPGNNGIGTLTAAIDAGGGGGVVFGANSTLDVQTGAPGVSDLLAIVGTGSTISLAATTDLLNVTATDVGTFTIAQFAGYAAGANVFNNVTLNGIPQVVNGAVVASDVTVAYNPTDIQLTVNAIPEPASAGLLAVAAAGLLGRRRRRA